MITKTLINSYLALAITLVFTSAAWAVEPVAVWCNGFGQVNEGYTLDLNGNTVVDNAITIASPLKVNFATEHDGITVLLKYGSFTSASENTAFFTVYASETHKDAVGFFAGPEKMGGIWNEAEWGTAQINVALPAGDGPNTAICRYRSSAGANNGSYLYFNGATSPNWGSADLRSGSYKANGITIGGTRGGTLATATGMTIQGIAIFEGALNPSSIADFTFPPPAYKSSSFDSGSLTMTASTIVGGAALGANSGGDWTGSPVYEAVRNSDTNKAVVLSNTAKPYNNSSDVGDGDFSLLAVAKIANLPETPRVIFYVGSSTSGGSPKGLVLAAVGSSVKLGYTAGSVSQTLISADSISNISSKYHSYLVTHVDNAVQLYIDGVAVADSPVAVPDEIGRVGLQIGGAFGGTNLAKVDGVACAVGDGIRLDEFAVWREDVSAFATIIASHYPVWPTAIDYTTDGDVLYSDLKAMHPGFAVNLTMPDGATLTIDEAIENDIFLNSLGHIYIKEAADYTLVAADTAKINAGEIEGMTYRFEKDYSAGYTLNLGAGTYEFKNAKITNNPGDGVTIQVQENDNVVLSIAGQYGQRGDVSLKVLGGNLQIGPDAGNQAIWYGKNNIKYEQSGGTVNVTATGTGVGNGNGFLIGWQGPLAQFDFTGGVFNLPNSRLNFWSVPIHMNVSGDATVKIKGLFAGNGNTHTATLADNAIIELGSLGWSDVPLTLNGGTLKAVDTTTMSAAISMGGNAVIDVPEGKEFTITGGISGSGVITKTGEGTLNLGTNRVAVVVNEGKIKLVATTDNLSNWPPMLTLPKPEGDTVTKENLLVVDSDGNSVDIANISEFPKGILTITLNALPAVTDSNKISDLYNEPFNFNEQTTGTLIINGRPSADNPVIITFDRDLPDGVKVTMTGYVKFIAKDGIEIPYNKISFDEDCTVMFDAIDSYEIPANAKVIAGTASGTITNAGTLTIGNMTSCTITNNGTLNVTGDSTYTLTNNGTLNINGGVSTITSDGQSVKGTINIAYGATYKSTNNDQVPYNGSVTTTINVHGTLDMGTTRWTVGGADTINLYGGCTVSGSGDKDGIFDLYRDGNVINVLAGEGNQASETVVTIPAPIRARNVNGNISIDQGMKLALTGGIKNGGDVAGATINMNGNGRLTGTIPLYGGTINLGTSVGTIDAKFVAESGDTALKLGQSSGGIQISTTDTADEPFLWVKSGATLQLYVKDFSGWNQAVTEYGWVKNEGTLNIRENDGSRYFRGHLVMKPGTTTTLYGTSQNFIVYGGNSDQAKAQMIVPASETAATATFAGEGTIQLNVNGSGGTAGSAWDIGANSTLDVQTKIIGSEAISKFGEGTLKISNSESTYNGPILLNAGSIVSKIALQVTCEDANKLLSISEVDADGYTTYSLVPAMVKVEIPTVEGATIGSVTSGGNTVNVTEDGGKYYVDAKVNQKLEVTYRPPTGMYIKNGVVSIVPTSDGANKIDISGVEVSNTPLANMPVVIKEKKGTKIRVAGRLSEDGCAAPGTTLNISVALREGYEDLAVTINGSNMFEDFTEGEEYFTLDYDVDSSESEIIIITDCTKKAE